jgi:hypothetical protein
MGQVRRGETVKYFQLSYTSFSCALRRTKPLLMLVLAVMMLGMLVPSYGQGTNVISCSSGFTSSGACGAGAGQNLVFAGNGGVALSGSQVNLIPAATTHDSSALNYHAAVNVQAFTAAFTFVPNGQNIAFVLQNNTNSSQGIGSGFVSGAGCEAGFFQAFGSAGPPNNIFALELDSYSPLTVDGSFTYSSAQIYQAGQSPCLPNDGGPNYTPIDKISTSPVNLTLGTQGSSTGDTYSATLAYDGSNLTLSMFDVTAGRACPGANCFTYTWNGVAIPTWVNSSTAYVGFTGATGLTSSYPLYVNSFSYTVGTPQTTVATPTFSPAAGTYTSAQSVAISDATSGAIIYYTTDGTTPTTSSTRYAAPITVSSTETIKAIAVAAGDTNSAVASATYIINSSSPPATVATPIFSPATGTYTSAQSVAISDATSGATIYYTTNGTTPTTASTQYSGAIAVNSTEMIEAIAVAAGDTNSAVASATYTINSSPPPVTVATPTFSPPGGTFTSAQSVSISDATSGATIYYTTNGTTPTTSSTQYAGPITVSSTETIKAIAAAAGDTNSAVASATYTINSSSPPPATVATPTFSPAGGTFTSAQSVSISDATSGATIYYTTNGMTPTTSSTQYSGPITVSSTEAIKSIAAASGDTNSAVASATYTITTGSPPVTAAKPTFSPAGGAFTTAQSVSISDATSGATIYYTTNGTIPTTSSTRYGAPITVSSTETIEAIATATGDSNSAVASATYTITIPPPTVSKPTFSPAGGTFTSAQSVTISDATSGATIYYTTNGTTPTTSSAKYVGAITVGTTETLEAMAAVPGDSNSAVTSAVYTINSAGSPPPTAATPTFSPVEGTYTSAQSVTISDTTSGATIYYTTNGSSPTSSSTRYSGAITVSTTETLEAIAVDTGESNSAVASAAYTITSASPPPTVATPTFSPGEGTYTSAQSVTISDATSGATIYYTTDGAIPTSSSAQYAGPITVGSTETLEAIAVDTGDSNSAVASAAYTIASAGSPPTTAATPTFSPGAGSYGSAQSVSISDATSGATIYYTTDGTTPTTSSTPYTGPIAVDSTETLQAVAADSGDTNSAVASAAYTITLQPGFVLTSSSPSLTVASGSQGTVTLTVTPENGFDSPVDLACSGLPSGVTCSFEPKTVTPSGGPVTSQVTISANVLASASQQQESRKIFPWTALGLVACFFGWKKRRGAERWLPLALVAAAIGLLCGCGDLHTTSAFTATPANSMVTISADSGTAQENVTVALTLN